MPSNTVILGYARTPVGKVMGGLAPLAATQLGGIAIAAAIERAGISPGDVDHVVMGQVLQAGAGQIPSRQASVAAGLPLETTSETINKVCASSHRAVTLADVLIRSGQHDVVVAGGMESMSNAPHLMRSLRGGVRMGDTSIVDSMIADGLTDPFRNVHMVVNGAEVAEELGISRERQDEWALRSHLRATDSRDFIAGEIVPVDVPGRRETVTVAADEAPRADTTLEKLASLRPIMKKDGTTTAGNAPGVNDGAAALVLASAEWAAKRELTPLATVGAHVYVGGGSQYLAVMPGQAMSQLLERTGLSASDIDRFEINEAFASVALHSMDMVGADPERVNVNGGAVAMGHPIGMSGARIIGTLARELQRMGGGRGIAAICSGGGQGDAVLIEVPAS